jgi:hypothetical protein
VTHGNAERVEFLIDAGAATLLAGAVGYAAMSLAPALGLSASTTALSFLGCFYGLRRIEPEAQAFPLREINSLPSIEPTSNVLELTDADRWYPQPADDDELLLDRELAHFGADSRVVRLFEPSAMPTAGELKSRIDRHLLGSVQSAPPDASQDLYDALAQLRRSLR